MKLELNWEEYKSIIYNLYRLELLNFGDRDKSNFIENQISIKFYVDEFVIACDKDNSGKIYQKEVVTIISDMNTPLGNNIGNALEVEEAIDVLIQSVLKYVHDNNIVTNKRAGKKSIFCCRFYVWIFS